LNRRVKPDFLAVGHVTRDRVPRGFVWGGAVTYGALTALRLGLQPAVVTSASSDLDVNSAFVGIPAHVVPSDVTTTVHNQYRPKRRSQVLESAADPISFPDVPDEWRSAPTVLLCPVAGEIGTELVQGFSDSLVMASLHGWLRTWDGLAGGIGMARMFYRTSMPQPHRARTSKTRT